RGRCKSPVARAQPLTGAIRSVTIHTFSSNSPASGNRLITDSASGTTPARSRPCPGTCGRTIRPPQPPRYARCPSLGGPNGDHRRKATRGDLRKPVVAAVGRPRPGRELLDRPAGRPAVGAPPAVGTARRSGAGTGPRSLQGHARHPLLKPK